MLVPGTEHTWGGGKDTCEGLYILGKSGRDILKERTLGKVETKVRFMGLCLGRLCRTVIVT